MGFTIYNTAGMGRLRGYSKMNKMLPVLNPLIKRLKLNGRGIRSEGRLAVREQRKLRRRCKWDMSVKVPNGMLLFWFSVYNTISVLWWKERIYQVQWQVERGWRSELALQVRTGDNQDGAPLDFISFCPVFSQLYACISVVLKTFIMILCACACEVTSVQPLQHYGP